MYAPARVAVLGQDGGVEARAWVGTSGWTYDSWQGLVYPDDVTGTARLDYYTAHLFDTVELNASYYRWPREATFGSWRRRLPPGFAMTVKAPRGLTHAKRLYAPERWLGTIGAGLRRLGDRLGVFLVQLPPGMERDDDRLRWFLDAVPRDWRLAMEFRHGSWECEDVFGLLERRGAAYVVKSGAGQACVLRATAPFVYVRFHGPSHEHLYGGSYSDADMWWWGERTREWLAQGRDVWAYFNNDHAGYAVRNAQMLRSAIGAREV